MRVGVLGALLTTFLAGQAMAQSYSKQESLYIHCLTEAGNLHGGINYLSQIGEDVGPDDVRNVRAVYYAWFIMAYDVFLQEQGAGTDALESALDAGAARFKQEVDHTNLEDRVAEAEEAVRICMAQIGEARTYEMVEKYLAEQD
ncbi:hypothetical protein [uncultured Shimia sp.]|uniref:hypothetical protein n=1 Tax=uncultured Shimia sp. TaxID=573152 RepID=UPI00263136DB|nr:hypothetical protein [uncultured Shimia sp.]